MNSYFEYSHILIHVWINILIHVWINIWKICFHMWHIYEFTYVNMNSYMDSRITILWKDTSWCHAVLDRFTALACMPQKGKPCSMAEILQCLTNSIGMTREVLAVTQKLSNVDLKHDAGHCRQLPPDFILYSWVWIIESANPGVRFPQKGCWLLSIYPRNKRGPSLRGVGCNMWFRMQCLPTYWRFNVLSDVISTSAEATAMQPSFPRLFSLQKQHVKQTIPYWIAKTSRVVSNEKSWPEKYGLKGYKATERRGDCQTAFSSQLWTPAIMRKGISSLIAFYNSWHPTETNANH